MNKKELKKDLKNFRIWQEDEHGGFSCSCGSLNNFEELWNFVDQSLAQKEAEVLGRVEEIAQGKVENSHRQFRGDFAQGYKLAASSIRARIQELNQLKESK